MAETWDETKPSGSRLPTLGDDDIREFKRAMRERLAFDHEFQSTESPVFGDSASIIGTHKCVRLNEQGSAPATLANQGAIYTKALGGVTELYMRGESDAGEQAISRGGMAKFNALAFNNGTYNFYFPTNQLADNLRIMLAPYGSIMWWYANAAPAGWKIVVASGDLVMAVKGGSVYTTGGAAAGTWTQPNHTHTGPSHAHWMSVGNHQHYTDSHVHSGPSHVHSGPNHIHQMMDNVGRTRWSDGNYHIYGTNNLITVGSATGSYAVWVESWTAWAGTGSTGAAGTGNTGYGAGGLTSANGAIGQATGAEGTGATGGGATANTWRPYAYVGVLCQLDVA